MIEGKIYDIDDIRKALEDRNLVAVAERTGLHPETLYRIVRKSQTGVSFETYTILIR